MRRGCGKYWPDWQGRMRGCGYRITSARQSILDTLADAKGHLSADDIYVKIHPADPDIGLATVYRTLEVLLDMGLVQRFDFGDGRSRYELTASPNGKKHHHHLVCIGCDRVIDYTDFVDQELELLKQTERGLAKKYNFNITGHVIQFHGLCSSCGKDKK